MKKLDSKSKKKAAGTSVAKPKAELNELDLALQLQQTHQLLYNAQTKVFLLYNTSSGLWEQQTDHAIKTLIVNYITTLKAKNQGTISPLNVTKIINAVCTLLRYHAPPPPMNTKHSMVAVKNGVLNLEKTPPRLVDHAPGHYLTNGSPVEYDSKAQCNTFKGVLLSSAYIHEDIRLLQKYFGSVLLGANDSQCILILKGTPGIGKSTLITILEETIGRSWVAYLRTQHLGNRFEMSGFLGKKLLLGKDVAQDFLSVKAAQILKSLVGGDLLQAERKSNNHRIDLHGSYHVAITCNSDIRIPSGQDRDAWQRRLLVVNSQHARPAKIIPNLAEQILKQEASGVLNWLIEGAIAHRNELKRLGAYELSARQQREIQQMIQA